MINFYIFSTNYRWNFTFRILGILILNAVFYGSCYAKINLPGTGNLLIGREHRLYASSTCGLTKSERYCVVTNLEDKKKCARCDSPIRYPGTDISHPISNVVPQSGKKKRWWQSENGVENVTIQLDLEMEFHFTHLYMKFKTFRPAAMLVERSYDFGKTWSVYRYLAFDCSKYFPYALKGPHRNLTVAYCDESYSSATPLTDGEVAIKVLPSTSQTIDPYSPEVQNLVKITNLRINFTKLHTLGDDLLDNRVEIKEKYYYAIWEMIVGGSCSCHGHANSCVPEDGSPPKENVVYGQCICTHNTKGDNCKDCEDLYNDVGWAPAVGKNTNACRKCNCNNHATNCHFDSTVFESTGRISGGVCDDCQHNTMGRNCEQCKHFFYQDPTKDFSSPDVCLKCDCDPAGSVDDGICDSRTDPINGLVSGKCHCKPNVEGRRCDSCKNGFWNFTEHNVDGCQQCSCHIHGTYDNQGCNKDTGECTCKRNVIGRDCNQCLPEYWGLGASRDGCQPCDCDPGGSYDNECDVISGQCRCRLNLMGRRCNESDQGFFAGQLDLLITEAEFTKCQGTCQVDIRQPYDDEKNRTWTGFGFVHVFPNSELDFPVENIDMSMDYYPIIRYEPEKVYDVNQVELIIEHINGTSAGSHNCSDSPERYKTRKAILSPASRYASFNSPVCLERGNKYNVRLIFTKSDDQPAEVPTASILVDSFVLVPRIESIPFMHGSQIAEERQRAFEQNRCADAIYSVVKGNLSDVCKQFFYSIGVFVHGGAFPCTCNSTGSYSSYCDSLGGHCPCKPNVVGRACDKCAPGTYGFGLDGCKACDCHSVGALDNLCDVYTGQCKCRNQTYGRVCDQCQPGSWNYPNCQRCICHGHADTCDPYTGACRNCDDYTEGHYCDRCIEGYYGDPRWDVNIPCRRCPCPGTNETHSYAKYCVLDPRTQDVICRCDVGYAGTRCEVCAENFFGNPEVPGGKCVQCNCSNNVDLAKPGNCDPHTGKCLQCLFNTEGFNCEVCKAGYYGDAINKLCKECSCSQLGTDEHHRICDRFTGQCPCLPNVTGLNCDKCIENHWKIASGVGCEPCSCDHIGSKSEQCNEYDGQCECWNGFGGTRCDQCQTNYWGNPNEKCFPCDCNPEGSAKLQCLQNNGTCECRLGIGGDKCDRCARGYLNTIPNCQACGECFDNWDITLNKLKDQTDSAIAAAQDIMKTGATGSYAKEFEGVEKKIDEIKQLLQNTTASSQQLKILDKLINDSKADLIYPSRLLTDIDNEVDNITGRANIASVYLNDLRAKSNNLNETANNLKNNITKLQEGNVEGALLLTKESYDKANEIKAKNANTANIISDAERQCKSTETLIDRTIDQFNQELNENKKHLHQLKEYENYIESVIPSINHQVCDKAGNPCDPFCGGAGCGSCGGLSCDNGAWTKSENALKFAEDAKKNISEKETKTGELYRAITQAQLESNRALEDARIASDKANSLRNMIKNTSDEASELTKKLENFLTSPRTSTANIRDVASKALQKTIELRPEEITSLAKEINDTISSLTDIPSIIKDTTDDLNNAQTLKHDANVTKMQAAHVLDTAEKVVKALKDAEASQKQAEPAVQVANKNISLAKSDLYQVFSKANESQSEANKTLTDVTNLHEQLKKVQSDFLKNSRDANEVETELKAVTDEISDTQAQTVRLQKNYDEVSKKLDDHKKNSSEIRQAAHHLLERAEQLAANTTAKLKDLMDSEAHFNDQEKQLLNVTNVINDLIKRMTKNFEEIGKKSDYYSNCIN